MSDSPFNDHLPFAAKYHNRKRECVFEGVKLELTLTLNMTAMTPAPISARMIHPTSTEYWNRTENEKL